MVPASKQEINSCWPPNVMPAGMADDAQPPQPMADSAVEKTATAVP